MRTTETESASPPAEPEPAAESAQLELAESDPAAELSPLPEEPEPALQSTPLPEEREPASQSTSLPQEPEPAEPAHEAPILDQLMNASRPTILE